MKKIFIFYLFVIFTQLLSSQTQVPVGPQTATFTQWVRGYHFTAPTTFTICGLYIPTNASIGVQNIAVVRFNAGAPPAFAATTNNFVQLFSITNYAPNTMIPCNIPVTAGQVIGVYGARGTNCVNSYDGVNFATNINGFPTTLSRSGMQNCLNAVPMSNIWSEVNYNIGRIFMYYNCCTPPAVTATPSQNPICAGTQLAILGGGATTYTWAPGNLTGSSINVSPTVTTTYTVSGTSNGCTGTGTVTVNVNPNPTVTATPTTICSGASATISSSGASSYTWNPGGLSGSSVSVTPASTTVYTVTGTSAAGCVGTATAQVTVNPAPAINPSSNSPLCAGTTLNLSAGAGATFSWTGPNGFTSSSSNPNISNVQQLNAGTYSVTVTSASGCISTGTTSVNVLANPVPLANNTGPYCAGAQIDLNASGGTSYSWVGPSGFSSTSQNPTIPSSTAAMSGNYTVTATAGSCTASITTSVTVNALPNVTVNSASICSGQGTATLTAGGALNYVWSAGLSSTGGPIVTASPTVTTQYTVTGTDGNNCTNTATSTV
ncbi:MAG: hypothetical protein ACK5D5_05095, partial [Bacteroidota bacterium]